MLGVQTIVQVVASMKAVPQLAGLQVEIVITASGLLVKWYIGVIWGLGFRGSATNKVPVILPSGRRIPRVHIAWGLISSTGRFRLVAHAFSSHEKCRL